MAKIDSIREFLKRKFLRRKEREGKRLIPPSQLGLQMELQSAKKNTYQEITAVSTGFLIQSGTKFLICHTTKAKGDAVWSISKGVPDENEPLLEAALRETFEETGIPLRAIDGLTIISEPVYCSFVARNKLVRVFFAYDPSGALQTFPCACTSMVTDKGAEHFPEMDEFKWVDLEEAEKLVFNSQKTLFSAQRYNAFMANAFPKT